LNASVFHVEAFRANTVDLIVLGFVWGLVFGSIGGGLAKLLCLFRPKR
jgi:hypothetical protein